MLKEKSIYSHPVCFYRSVNTRYVDWIPLLTWCRSPVTLDTGSGPRPYFPPDIKCNILEGEIAALDSIHKLIAETFSLWRVIVILVCLSIFHFHFKNCIDKDLS